MRVRILSLVLVGLVVTPLAGWTKCAIIDPDGVCLEEAIFSLGGGPDTVVDLTNPPVRAAEPSKNAASRPKSNRGEAVSDETLLNALFHWLAGLSPGV